MAQMNWRIHGGPFWHWLDYSQPLHRFVCTFWRLELYYTVERGSYYNLTTCSTTVTPLLARQATAPLSFSARLEQGLSSDTLQVYALRRGS